MLDTTLATEFIPGTNIRGEVAGANWTFLLPQLELGRVICFGAPQAAALVTLARRADRVTVRCANAQQLQQVNVIREQYDLSNLCLMDATTSPASSLPALGFDLAVIVDGRSALRDLGWLANLQRVLTAKGLIYVEFGGPIERLWNGKALAALTERLGAAQVFWLTPLGGEMHTAVVMHDDATIDYFVHNRLYSSSVDLRVVKRTAQSLLRGQSRKPVQPQPLVRAAVASQADIAGGGGQKHRALLDLIGQVQRTLDSAERFVSRHRSLSHLTQRYGVLVGRAPAAELDRPPLYLCEIARTAGINLAGYRWGLSARGEYSSRKVLFFLFNGANQIPEYVVKMTRASALNPRLENESRALRVLHDKGVGDCETLPQVAFFGHHNDLAIVGETVIQGMPFEQQTSATAECLYVRAAIDWLIELGAATVNSTKVSPSQVAEALRSLFRRFTEIYRLSPEHHDFLSSQLTAIGQNPAGFPLVFQHGDPGTWNVMVSPTGRVAFLDWEAAETEGMPLWDLFYFMRAYGVLASRRAGIRNMLHGFVAQFLHDTAISALQIEATTRCCTRIGLPYDLVEPLFYTCWMHRALKEASRLAPSDVDRGHYISLLRLCIDQRAGATFQRLFSRQAAG
jgi:hypothetical protein